MNLIAATVLAVTVCRVAASAMGIALALAAILRIREKRALVTADSALPRVVQRIRGSVERSEGVIRVNRVLTMRLGPEKVLIALDATFDASTPERLTQTAERLRESIKRAHPYVRQVFIDEVRGAGRVGMLRAELS